MDSLSSSSHLGSLQGTPHNRRVFENILGGVFSSVWKSFMHFVAGRSKLDHSLSFYPFRTSRCNLRSILLSHKNDP